MKIAQIAPLMESIPPRWYGGTERIVSYLTEELVRRGHDVTLFASGDSLTSAKLVAGSPRSLRLAGLTKSGAALHGECSITMWCWCISARTIGASSPT